MVSGSGTRSDRKRGGRRRPSRPLLVDDLGQARELSPGLCSLRSNGHRTLHGPRCTASHRRPRHRSQPREDRGRYPERARLPRSAARVRDLRPLPLEICRRPPDCERAALSPRPAAETARSRALSKDLIRRSFRFVGPKICYAFMQSVGLVNDHIVGCFRRRPSAKSGDSSG
jgi:hypothetical protein